MASEKLQQMRSVILLLQTKNLPLPAQSALFVLLSLTAIHPMWFTYSFVIYATKATMSGRQAINSDLDSITIRRLFRINLLISPLLNISVVNRIIPFQI
ncbi:hypothetical protein HOLleu_01344 [Holothuria leucospilota]|uniref:Uncharacterized protein n=1 Tax=Holothuria leucospilota TaxID=206669 RepID=A0A9Q1CQ73_HOLLE|nr:hypothetical protein HOLleu_01344 [Holothuria leucospilota]